jgi:CSLREA domain-containing protein
MRRFSLAVLTSLTLLAAPSAPAPALATSGPTPRLGLPASAQVGQAVDLTLALEGAPDLGGYEAVLSVDPAAAELYALTHHPAPFAQQARQLIPLGPVGSGGQSAFGVASCRVDSCATVTSGLPDSPGASGDQTLATLTLRPLQAGTLELRLELRAVSVAGQALPAAPPQTFRLPVGTGGPLFLAPVGLAPRAGSAAKAQRNDLTGDGRTSYADLMEVALAWTHRREAGDPCAVAPGPQGDVDADACVDVADLQLLAEQLGETPAPAPRQSGATLSVTSAGDAEDAAPGDGMCATASGVCTLRAAIAEANAQSGPNTITFDIAGPGPHSILLTRPLPSLADESGPTTIDGYTQPLSAPNTHPLVSDAQIGVQIGIAAGVAPATIEALHITTIGNVVRGLALFGFRRAIFVYGANADSNTIVGNFIGTNAAGTYAASTIADSANGVELSQGASRNRIGGTSPADRNVISGNAKNGVATFNGGSDKNVIVGNLIGLAPAGDRALPNISHGVDINSNSAANEIGGTQSGARNVIAGNGGEGVEVSHGQRSEGNRVVGNRVGSDAEGKLTAFSPNGWRGVHVEDGPVGTVVAQNLIVGNRLGGLLIDGLASGFSPSATQVYSNQIGLAADASPAGNLKFGIRVADLSSNSVIGPGNLIAHNPVGIQVDGAEARQNTISQNSLFANTQAGIELVNGANEDIATPRILSASTALLRGTACGGCRVELFLADETASAPQGRQFLGASSALADGSFSLPLAGLSVGMRLTASATDSRGNTSEFAPLQSVTSAPNPTPSPSPSPSPSPRPGPSPSPSPRPDSSPSPSPAPIPDLPPQRYLPLVGA